MVIGSLFFRRRVRLALLIAPAFFLPVLRLVADDQIVKKDGSLITGTIVSVSDGQVMVESRTSTGGTAKVPYYISDIKSVNMVVPADVAKAEAPDLAITTGAYDASPEPRIQWARKRPIVSFKNFSSAGLLPAPAVCPHSDGIGISETFGMNAAS